MPEPTGSSSNPITGGPAQISPDKPRVMEHVEGRLRGRKVKHHRVTLHISLKSLYGQLKHIRTFIANRFAKHAVPETRFGSGSLNAHLALKRPRFADLPMQAGFTPIPNRGDHKAWESLKAERVANAEKPIDRALNRLVEAVENKQTRSAVKAMYDLRTGLIQKYGASPDKLMTGMHELLQNCHWLPDHFSALKDKSDYLEAMGEHLSTLIYQETNDGHAIGDELAMSAQASCSTVSSVFTLLKRMAAPESEPEGRRPKVKIDRKMMQDCFSGLYNCRTRLEQAALKYSIVLTSNRHPERSTQVLDELIEAVQQELLLNDVYPDADMICSYLEQKVPFLFFHHAVKEKISQSLLAPMGHWMVVVENEAKGKSGSEKIRVANTMNKALLKRSLYTEQMAAWDEGVRPGIKPGKVKSYQAYARQSFKSDSGLLPPAARMAQPAIQPLPIATNDFVELRLNRMLSALTQEHTTEFVEEGYQLLQQIAREANRNQYNPGGDGLAGVLQNKLRQLLQNPELRMALAAKADYLDQLTRVIEVFPKQKMQSGELAADHLSVSAMSTMSTFDHILSACQQQAYPDVPFVEGIQPPADMVQEFFDVLSRCSTPMEQALGQLPTALLAGNVPSQLYTFIADTARDELRSQNQSVTDDAVMEQVQGQIMEMMLSGQSTLQLQAAYQDPQSPLFQSMSRMIDTAQASVRGVPLELPLTCHQALTRKLGIHDQVMELISQQS